MSLKQELQLWSNALDAFDAQDFELCISLFQDMPPSSKIHFNLGLVHATIGQHALAVEQFEQALALDPYLAVAYFQEGVSNFLLARYAEARRDFDDAFVYLRSNLTIDYEQLGLKFRLYSCEVLFNRGLAAIYMGLREEGMADLAAALEEKQTAEHSVIDEAITDRGAGYTVFSIPVGILFRPSATKLKNLPTKNYLGQAKLVAALDARDAFTGFSGTGAGRVVALDEGEGEQRRGLERSRTRAARLERSGDGVAKPLRRRPTVEEMGGGGRPVGGKRMSMGRSLGVGRSLTTRTDGGGGLAGLPTPPPSEGKQQGNPSSHLTTYGGLLESYYVDDGSSALPAPLMPTTSRPLLPSINTSHLPSSNRSGKGRPSPSPASGEPLDRVARWAHANANAAAGGAMPAFPSTSSGGGWFSRQSSASERGGGGRVGGGAGRQRMDSLGGNAAGRSPEEAERGVALFGEREMSKVRVKLRFQGDTRGMSITPDMRLEDFVERVRVKFARASDLGMKYKDSDDALVFIIDADDWESAMDQAREAAQGRAEGKLEILLAEPGVEGG